MIKQDTMHLFENCHIENLLEIGNWSLEIPF
jgi:hypothetical protein